MDRPVALQLVAVHLARDEDGRGRIEVAAGDTGQQVGRPGAARGHRNPWDARDARVALGSEGCPLLMVHAHDADVPGLMDRVQEVSDHSAYQLENTLDA